MKNIILILFLIMNLSSRTYTQNLGHKLHDAHANFIEKTITKRRFGYKILVDKIDSLKQNKLFDVSVATKSTEGRDIYLIKCGQGKPKCFYGRKCTETKQRQPWQWLIFLIF